MNVAYISVLEGMEGYEDPLNRRPYPWGKEDEELLDFYREMGKIRLSLPLLKDGYYTPIAHEKSVFVYKRFNEKGECLTAAVNLSKEQAEIILDRGACSVFDKDSTKKQRQILAAGAFDLWI